jgi:hypothetical protein
MIASKPPIRASLRDGCPGVRLDSWPATGAELTGSLRPASHEKDPGPVAHAGDRAYRTAAGPSTPTPRGARWS